MIRERLHWEISRNQTIVWYDKNPSPAPQLLAMYGTQLCFFGSDSQAFERNSVNFRWSFVKKHIEYERFRPSLKTSSRSYVTINSDIGKFTRRKKIIIINPIVSAAEEELKLSVLGKSKIPTALKGMKANHTLGVHCDHKSIFWQSGRMTHQSCAIIIC